MVAPSKPYTRSGNPYGSDSHRLTHYFGWMGAMALEGYQTDAFGNAIRSEGTSLNSVTFLIGEEPVMTLSAALLETVPCVGEPRNWHDVLAKRAHFHQRATGLPFATRAEKLTTRNVRSCTPVNTTCGHPAFAHALWKHGPRGAAGSACEQCVPLPHSLPATAFGSVFTINCFDHATDTSTKFIWAMDSARSRPEHTAAHILLKQLQLAMQYPGQNRAFRIIDDMIGGVTALQAGPFRVTLEAAAELTGGGPPVNARVCSSCANACHPNKIWRHTSGLMVCDMCRGGGLTLRGGGEAVFCPRRVDNSVIRDWATRALRQLEVWRRTLEPGQMDTYVTFLAHLRTCHRSASPTTTTTPRARTRDDDDDSEPDDSEPPATRSLLE